MRKNQTDGYMPAKPSVCERRREGDGGLSDPARAGFPAEASLGTSREGEMPWALSYCHLSRVNQGNYANATPHASIRVSSSRAVSRVSLVDALALPLRSDVRA